MQSVAVELDVVNIPQGLPQVHLGLVDLYFERISEEPQMCVRMCVCVCARASVYVCVCAYVYMCAHALQRTCVFARIYTTQV